MSEQNMKKEILEKRRDRKIMLFIIIFVVVVAFFIQFIYYLDINKIKEIRTFDMSLKVSDYFGLNADTDILAFGTVRSGGAPTKYLELDSSEPTFVKIKVEGELAKWTKVSDNNFILDGAKNVSFYINVPFDAELGNYTGMVKVYLREP